LKQFVLRSTTTLAAFAVLGVALVLTLTTARPAAAVVGNCTPDASWGTLNSTFASQVVALVNQHRQALGLPALGVSPTLAASAQWKSLHMSGYGYMQHDDPAPPVARTVSDRLAACGYPIGLVGWGENIAYGYSTPTAVMTAWLNSPGHRANIENASYRAIGVGVARSSSGLYYWTQDFGTLLDSGSAPPPPTTSAPTVTLTSAPPSTTTSTSASFAWTTTGSPTSVACSLDGGVAVGCSSPKSYMGLGAGNHSFAVTVSNNAGSRTASYVWTVSGSTTTIPAVTLTAAPPASTTSTSASFSWSTTGSPTATRCSLDGAAAVSCASPASYGGLAVGSHTFVVTVSNSAGSRSASYAWTVTSPTTGSSRPTVQFTSTPPSTTSSGSALFYWTTTGSPTSTTCSLDYGVSYQCTSPEAYGGLAFGTHRLSVTVRNAYGFATAVYTWSITP